MRILPLLMPVTLALAACSETPVEEQGDEAIAERETQIQEEAQSLEEAADDAVKALEEDIDAQMAADGIGAPAAEPVTAATEN